MPLRLNAGRKGFPIYAGAAFVLFDKLVSVLQYVAPIDFVIETVESMVLGFTV